MRFQWIPERLTMKNCEENWKCCIHNEKETTKYWNIVKDLEKNFIGQHKLQSLGEFFF